MDFESPYHVPVYMQSMQDSNKDEMVICPYDPVHRISVKRFVRHIHKCKKNHPNANMATCPFNARHIIPKPEMEQHIEICPDKDSDINFMVAESEISVIPTSYEELYFGDEEDWDEEARNNTQSLPMVRGRRRQKRNEINPFPSVYEAEALHKEEEIEPRECPAPPVRQRRPIPQSVTQNGIHQEQKPSNMQLPPTPSPKSIPVMAAKFTNPVQQNGESAINDKTMVQKTLLHEKRKLNKLLNQISNMESQQTAGEVLNSDQLEKIGRKSAMKSRLLEVENLLERITL
uniref:Gametocyte-specific factor 1 homolog n=1 Tax=Ciona intestinalis TaxID=7719 RepID=F6X515_CIOIN|nr:gametocyte-specific factor 1 homolog [Ciona intestinalis]|eukprot:XP_002126196.1 gametocyte-specific factor 1 homolog [Ciona intestinalis]